MAKIKVAERRMVPIGTVRNWKKNPKRVKKADYFRLRNQIVNLGLYKPLLCCWDEELERWLTLGGNTRLKVLRDLNVEEVEISIVEAPGDARKLEYALSDNDEVGRTDPDLLAELAWDLKDDISLKDFKVNLEEPAGLSEILEEVGPDSESEGLLHPEVEFSQELLEEHNFVVLYFENEVDWNQALTILELKTVKPLHTVGAKWHTQGIGRVVEGPAAIQLIQESAARS